VFPYETTCGGRVEAVDEVPEPPRSFDEAVVLQEQEALIPGKLPPGVVPGSKVVTRVFPDKDLTEEGYQLARGGVVQPVGTEEEVVSRARGMPSNRFA
jgi:hypothetical protein